MQLRRLLGVVAAVYVIEGFPMGIFMDVWPVYLRRFGMSLVEIGWLSGIGLAWSLKVLWSPLVDRFGSRRAWIVGALCVMAVCLLALVQLDPRTAGIALWICLTTYCLASASQDIAIDAYTIGLSERGQEGPINGVRITAYRVGLLASGGGLLLLPESVGWPARFAIAAAITLAMAVGVTRVPPVAIPPAARQGIAAAMGRWLQRPGAVAALAFVLLYRLGDASMAPMVKPFWVDAGFSDREIGTVSVGLGVAATVLGALVGGAAVSRMGIVRSLWWLGAFALLSNLAYAGAALTVHQGPYPVYAASVVESFCSGLATSAFLAFLMRACERERAAVQFALLTALYALPKPVIGPLSGWLTDQVGYATYFALTAAIALPAFVLIPKLKPWAQEQSF